MIDRRKTARHLRAENYRALKPRFEHLEARHLLTASIQIGDAEILEGQADATVLSFPVTISQAAPAGGVVVNYEFVDGDAVAGAASAGGDYVAAPGTVVFAAGETLPKQILVNINPDVTVEGDETFQVQVTSVVGDVEVTKDSAVGTILNDDDNNDFVQAFRDMGPDDLIGGVDEVLIEIQNAIVVAMDGVADLPVIGPQLRDGVQPVLDSLDSARAALIDGVNAIFTDGLNVGPDDDLIEAFQQTIFSIFGPDGLFGSDGILIDSLDAGSDLSRDDIRLSYGVDEENGVPDPDTEWFQFDFHLGQRKIVDLPFEVGADLELGPGLEAVGLTIDGEDGLRFDLRWDLRLGLGLSELYGREAADFFYLNAGAVDQTGAPVEEFRATIEVTSAPPKDAAGNDLLVEGRGLKADATFGPLAATVVDAIPFAVDVTAPTGIDTEPVTSGDKVSFTLVVIDDDVVDDDGNVVRQEFPINDVDLPENELEIPEFLTNLNLEIGEVLGAADHYSDVPFPGPVSVTLDFSRINGFRNPDLPTTPSLVFGARLPSISSMTIVGGGEMGFLEDPNHSLAPGGVGGQPDDGRSTGIGFGAGQTSEGDALVQELIAGDLAPAGGLLLDDASFFLNLDDERVTIKIREAVNRDVTSLEDQVDSKSLETLVRNAVNLAVAQKGLAPIEVAVADGKFVFRSTGTVADPAPTLTIDYSTSQSSKIQVGFTVDIEDPQYNPLLDIANPDQQRFRNRLEKGEIDSADKKTDVFKPSLSGGIGLKLHASANLDNFTEAVAPSLGFADGELRLPGFEFDFIFDVTAKVASEEVDDDANPGEKKNELKFSKTVETVQFDNVTVDLGGLIESVVIPLSNVLGETLGPVLSLIGDAAAGTTGFLDEPIPLLDDIGLGNRSILDLTGNKQTLNRFNDAIQDLAGVGEGLTEFLASYNGDPIAMGCYEYDTGDDGLGLVPCEIASVANSSVALEQFLGSSDNQLITDGGVVYDVLQPENIIKLLGGEVADLISLRIPQVDLLLGRSFGFNFKALDADIAAAADLTTSDLGFVYDTTGMRQIADAFRTGADPDWADLLDGFYIANQEGPEVDLNVSLDGSASVDASPIISGSVSVDLHGSAELDVFDPNMDGQLRLDEIMEVTNDFASPKHLFCASAELSGDFDLEAKLGEDPLEVDVSTDDLGFSPSFDVSLTPSDILGFLPGACTFGDPILATPIDVGGERILRLNTGPVYADDRLYGDTDDNDGFVKYVLAEDVDADGNPRVVIDATLEKTNFDSDGNPVGIEEVDYSDSIPGSFARIIGWGGPNDDEFDLSDVSIPVVIDGGRGNDTIIGGSAGDELRGGLGDDLILPADGDDFVWAGFGENIVGVSLGADVIDATDNDVPFSYAGDAAFVDGDTVLGSRFGDHISGTRLYGFDGDDTLDGSDSPSLLEGGAGNDMINGGPSADKLFGGPGDDVIFGREGDDLIEAGSGDDEATGDGGQDMILGQTGDDRLDGGSGDDQVDGGAGNDTVIGGAGFDTLLGAGGSDILTVGSGDLSIDGGAAFDTLTIDFSTEIGATTATISHAGFEGDVDGTPFSTPYLAVEDVLVITGGLDDAIDVAGAIAPLTIDTQGGADAVNVLAATAPVTIKTGDGDDEITLVRHDGPISIDSGSDVDALTIDRTGRDSPQKGTVGAAFVTGFGNGDVTFDDLNLPSLIIDLGTGQDIATLDKTSSNTYVTVNGGVGDRVDIDQTDGTFEANAEQIKLIVNSDEVGVSQEFINLDQSILRADVVVIDNSENSSQVDFLMEDRAVIVDDDIIFDASEVGLVRFLGSVNNDELSVADTIEVDKAIRLNRNTIEINRGERVIEVGEAFDQNVLVNYRPAVTLKDSHDIVFSPDGEHAYVRDTGAIRIFSVDGDDKNQLYPIGDYVDGDLSGPKTPGNPEFTPEVNPQLGFSPDGNHLYDVSGFTIRVFSRDASTGALTLSATTDLGGRNILVLDGVQFTQDGQYAFVAAHTQQVITSSTGASFTDVRTTAFSFTRDATTGSLTILDGLDASNFFNRRYEPLLSHDGKYLYAQDVGIIGWWEIDPATGMFVDYSQDSGADSMTNSSIGIVGDVIYIAGGDANPKLVKYARDAATGSVTMDVERALPGTLDAPTDIEISADGKRLSVVTQDGGEYVLLTFDISAGALDAPDSKPFSPTASGRRSILSVAATGDSIHVAPLNTEVVSFEYSSADRPVETQRIFDGQAIERDLVGIDQLVFAPDAAQAYGISQEGVLTEFARNAGTGQLTADDAEWDGAEGVNGLAGASDIAVFEDAIYVAGKDDNAISMFRRTSSNGDLAFLSSTPLQGVQTLALSADGSVLVAAGSNEMVIYEADPNSSGQLLELQRIGLLGSKNDVAFSADSETLYVARGSSVLLYRFNDDDEFVFNGSRVVSGIFSLLLSDDGENLYVGTDRGDVAVFGIEGNSLSSQPIQTLSNGSDGVRNLSRVDGLAMSNDGNYLFAASGADGAIVSFRRDTDNGALRTVQRLADANLRGATSLAVSPDGAQLYASNRAGAAGGWSAFDIVADPSQQPVTYKASFDAPFNMVRVNSAVGASVDLVSIHNPPDSNTTIDLGGGDDEVVVVNNESVLTLLTQSGQDFVDLRATSPNSTTTIELGDEVGSGGDSIQVNGPGMGAPVTIRGQNPTSMPGDSLVYLTGGRTLTPSTLSFPDGTATVPDAAIITYTGIENPSSDALAVTIDSPPTIAEGEGITLTASSNSNSFAWDLDGDGEFDDAISSTVDLSWEQLQEFGLGDDGQYSVAVRALFANGVAFAAESITITNVDPVRTPSILDPVKPFEPFRLELVATGPGDDAIVEWQVDWGDGKTDTYEASSAIVEHVYAEAQPKTIVIKSYDEDNFDENDRFGAAAYVDELPVNVMEGDPRERTISGELSLLEGQLADFTLGGSGGLTDAVRWTVNFGDGASTVLEAAAGNVQHRYADDGVYRITSVVKESDGTFQAATEELLVTVVNVPPALVLSGPDEIDEGEAYVLSLAASDPGEDDISSWQIDWGDGSRQVVVGGTSAVVHRYGDDGLYTINVTATDEDGSYVAPAIDVTVNNVALHEISGPDSVNEDQVYLLELASLDPGDDTVSEWAIDWGDGSAVETFDGGRRFVSHVYTGGFVTRTITATATDEDGTFPTNSLTVDVLNVQPMPVISGASFAREASPYLLTLRSNTTIDTPIVRWEVTWDVVSPLQVVELEVDSAHQVVDFIFADGLDQTTIFATAIDAAGNRYPAAPLDVEGFNIAPTIAVSNPSTVDEGSTFTLALGEITEPAPDTVTDYIIFWGDGKQDTYTVAEIAALGEQVTHEYGDNSQPSLDPVNFPDPVTFVAIGLVDEDGTHRAAGFSTVEVLNVAPVVANFTSDAATAATKSTDKHVTVTGSIVDVGAFDTHIVNIAWGDGTVSEGVPVDPATRTFTADNDYNSGGVYQITVTAIDDDGGVSEPVSTSAVIQGVGIVGRNLFIVGSNDQDRLEIDYDELIAEFSVALQLNLDEFGNSADQLQTTVLAADIDNITAVLCAGNDHFAARVSEDVVGPGDENGRPIVEIVVDGSLGNDEYVIEANSIDAPLTIIGGDDDDVVNVGAGDLDWIESDIQVASGEGRDSLIVDDRLQLESTAYDLSPGVARWDDSPDSPHVVYDDELESLRVEGGLGADVFTVTPSPVIDITVDGNAPVTGSVPPVQGDALFLRTDSTAPRRISFDPPKSGNGTWSFADGSKDLAFESIERFNRVERLAIAGEAAQDGRPLVKVFDAETKELLFQFFAYEEDFRDGVRVATGDVDGDGIPDIVVAPGRLHEPLVKMFDGLGPAAIPAAAADVNETGMIEGDDFLKTQRNMGATQSPEDAVSSWEQNYGGAVAEAISQASSDAFKLAEFLAYDEDFIGGVALAVGDVTGDAVNDVVVAPSRGPSEVRVFENVGFSSSFDLFDAFLAYPTSFIGGAAVAVGDLTGDGLGDIVTSTGSGSYVNIRVFDGQDLQTVESGMPIEDFVAFDDSVRGGSFVAVGNVVGDFTADIVLGGGAYADSRVQVFDGANLPAAGTQFASPDLEYRLTISPEENHRAPVRIAIKDYDLDGVADTVFGAQGADGEAQWLREFSPLDESLVDALFEDDAEFINGFWIG